MKICNDDLFWLMKLDYDFTYTIDDKILIPSQYVTLYQDRNMKETGKDTYRRWSKILSNYNDTDVKSKNTDVILFKLDRKDIFDKDNLHLILEILYPISGDINILRRVLDVGTVDIIDSDDIDKLINNKLTDALDLLQSLGRVPDFNNIMNAIDNDDIESLELLAQRNILPTQYIANNVAYYGKINILEWMEQYGILPDVMGADSAAGNGKIQVLRWLEERNILPDYIGADVAASEHQFKVLRWLEKRDIFSQNFRVNLKERTVERI